MNAEEEAVAWKARHNQLAATNHLVENKRTCLKMGCTRFDGMACTQGNTPDKCTPVTRSGAQQSTDRQVRRLFR